MGTISKSLKVKWIFTIILKNISSKFIEEHGNFYKIVFVSSVVYAVFLENKPQNNKFKYRDNTYISFR